MSLLNTRLQDLRVSSPNLDRWTLRPSVYGALDMFVIGNSEGQSIVSQALLAQAATAVGRAVTVPVYDSRSVSIGSTRSVTIADSENTSQLFTISFTTYAWGFTHVPAMYQNNEMADAEDWNRKFNTYLIEFAKTVDNQCISALSAAKSQVFAETLQYTNTGNVIIASDAQKDEIIGDMSVIMNANDYPGGPYRVLMNPGMQSQVNKMLEHAQYNDQDKTIQFLDKTWHMSNRLANAAGHKATGYIVNPGSLGMVWRHEREAIRNTVLPDGHEWMRDMLPGLGIPVDTYFYYGVGDYSAIGGASTADMTRVAKEHYGFAIELATVTAYNTDLATYANPIVKFAIATS